MQRVNKFRTLWLIFGISSAVLLAVFIPLIIIFGLRRVYLPMGIFAALTLGLIYSTLLCFISYSEHRIYTRIVAALTNGKGKIADIADTSGIKAEYVSLYISKAMKKKYIVGYKLCDDKLIADNSIEGAN